MATIGDGVRLGCGVIIALALVPVSCAVCGGMASVSSANYERFREQAHQDGSVANEQSPTAEVTLGSDCRMRALPSTDADIVGMAPAGTYAVHADRAGWSLIRVNGTAGWVGCR